MTHGHFSSIAVIITISSIIIITIITIVIIIAIAATVITTLLKFRVLVGCSRSAMKAWDLTPWTY